MKMLRTLFLTGSVLMMLCACGERKEPAAEADPPAAPTAGQDEPAPAAQPEPEDTLLENGGDGETKEKAEQPAPPETPETPEEDVTVIKDSDGSPLLTACVTRPALSDLVEGAALKAINRYYDDLYRQEQDWWSEDLVDFARETKKASADYGGSFLPFTVNESSQVLYNGEAFLSVRRDLATYTGGAHGSNAISCDNFRKSDGSLVQLSELFREDNYKEILLQKMTEQIESAGDSMMLSANWPSTLESTFDETHFLIEDEALTIVYQEYDIAPYAAGAQLFRITYADLSNDLDESFLRDIYGGKK